MRFDLNKPLVVSRQDVPALLENLQGNIVKSHGRRRAAHIFLRFNQAYSDESRSLLASFAPQLTSAIDQEEQTKRFRERGKHEPVGSLVSLWLSAHGFRALGLEAELPLDEAFREGMPGRRKKLQDTTEDQWEDHLKRPHALLLIADDTDAAIARTQEKLLAEMPACLEIMQDERGGHLDEKGRDLEDAGPRFEPFGFREGLANPKLVGTVKDWDGGDVKGLLFPLKQVLIEYPDRSGSPLFPLQDGSNEYPAHVSYGSFFVFRKLEQDIARFQTMVEQLAHTLNQKAPDEEYAAALVMGRFRDGTSLFEGGTRGSGLARDEFSADERDRLGLKCPFQAHIRRANRRGESGTSMGEERSRLIVRRGIPYRHRFDEAYGEAKETLGTLFICCQSSIKRQFEYAQRYWINGEGSMALQDALAGQSPRREVEYWPTAWGSKDKARFLFESCITLKGGEYFFAPPISYLRSLGGVKK